MEGPAKWMAQEEARTDGATNGKELYVPILEAPAQLTMSSHG